MIFMYNNLMNNFYILCFYFEFFYAKEYYVRVCIYSQIPCHVFNDLYAI